MLLYDKKEKTIDVYEFTADKKDLYDYRKEQMEKICEDKLIYMAEAYKTEETKKYKYWEPLFIRHKDSFNSKTIPMSHANSYYYGHRLIVANPQEDHKKYLLDSFYTGNFSKGKIARIMDEKNIRYFLLTWEYYSRHGFQNCDSIMGDIIEVPETLYFLQLLEQEKFSFLEEKDISEQLSLYSLRYIDEVDLDELKKIDELNMAKGCFTKTMNKANRDSIILQKYRKIK